MNDNYIKEYEEMSLCDFADELVEPLCTIKKDLTKTIYIHYAKERDKNDELVQENARLKDKIEKTKQFYTRELLKRENLKTPMKMSWESVEMFNILDGNK